MNRKIATQSLCVEYLNRLKNVANKYGLSTFINEIIEANAKGECEGTEEECQMLSRMVDNERITRKEIPSILGKSYRKAVEDNDFDNPMLKKLRHVGIYSKVSALLFKYNK
jgi:hypothetical protein